jgi:hypothetical protein
VDYRSRKLSTGSVRRGAPGGILSSLKQLIWPSDRNSEESSDNNSDSDGASTQGQEGSSDDELNQGISELSVDGGVGEGGVGSVEVEVCVDVRTTIGTATQDGITDDLSLTDQQEYTFEDHHLVDLSHDSHFDSSGFFLASSHVTEPEGENDDDDDVSLIVMP